MHCKEFSTAAKASVEATKLSNGTHVNTRVLEALVSRVESRRGCKSHVHDKDASASQSMQTAGLNVGSERNAELDTCRAEEEEGGQEDRDEYMREEAGRLLAALSTLDTTLVDAPVGTPDESVGDSANELHDADAESRQRTFLVRPCSPLSVLKPSRLAQQRSSGSIFFVLLYPLDCVGGCQLLPCNSLLECL